MLLMLEVIAARLFGDSRQFWREHAMLQKPVPHVVILPTPSPEVGPIAIDPFILFAREYGDAPKKVLRNSVTCSVDLLTYFLPLRAILPCPCMLSKQVACYDPMCLVLLLVRSCLCTSSHA